MGNYLGKCIKVLDGKFYKSLSQHFAGTRLKMKICLEKLVAFESAHKSTSCQYLLRAGHLPREERWKEKQLIYCGNPKSPKGGGSCSKSLPPEYIRDMRSAGKIE